MPDPSPFLSTIAATSAAMVAIVGGLLVARFVSIASEQEGTRRLLDDAAERLTTARRRAQDTREALRTWDTREFFGWKVLRAIRDGEQDVPALRKVGFYSSLTDDEIARGVQAVVDEFAKAEAILQPIRTAAKTKDSDFFP